MCFVKRSLVPNEIKLPAESMMSGFRGMGINKINSNGVIELHIVFRDKAYENKFIILPDVEAIMALVVGNDLLNKMDICLCQKHSKKSYARNELLHFKEESITSKISLETENALELIQLKSQKNKVAPTAEVSCKTKMAIRRNPHTCSLFRI